MPRQAANPTTATLIASALIASLVLTAIPATAAVNTSGDVKPVAPGGFGIPPVGTPGLDDNGDNIADWIDDQGNNVFDNLADPNNPAGGNGLAWDDERIWVDFDTTQNILVGERATGILEINGGSALRYQHLVLGGASELGSNGRGDLALSTTDGEDYNFIIDLQNATPRGTLGALSNTGSGTVNVTGIGSVFNNDPNIIPEAFQSAINFASGNDQGTPVGTTPANGDFTREDDRGFDVYVGLLGTGRLNVTAGGRVEIQDALMAGVAASANGRVTVDGAGSYLAAYGRTEYDPGGSGVNQQLGGLYASFIGGNGNGTLIVSDGGQADFFSGLSAAAANNVLGIKIAQADTSSVNGNPISSGEITVTGNGSLLTVGAPNTAVRMVNNASLAVGELRDFETPGVGAAGGPGIASTRYDAAGSLVVTPGGITDGTPYLGTAVLRIEDGGEVFVTGDQGLANAAGTDVVTGAVQIGFGSAVELRNGALNVTGAMVNDGTLNGVGDVRATRLDTSLYSRIRGGDPDTEPTSPSAEPLRISLAGSGIVTSLPTPTFVNRGSVEGLIDLTVAGDIANGVVERDGIVNGGTIDAGGFITARSLTTTTQSRLTGNSTTGSPLRIRLDSQDQVDVNSGTTAAPAFGALQNFGLIDGAIDLVTPGGLVNGANFSTDTADINAPDSGTITANGSFRVGTFLNHRFGLVSVGQGESLSIKASAEMGVVSTGGLILEDGIDSRPGLADGVPEEAEYRIANLGKILVNGGTFEATVLEESRGPVLDGAINHDRLFRNARTVIVDGSSTSANPVGIESVGTIVSTDATLDFGQGIYNTGVVSFNGGDNIVRGVVFNAGFFRPADAMAGLPDRNGINYDGGEEYLRQGVIVVSGDGTTATFTDAVNNTGMISIGPSNNVVNFLGDLDNTGGTIQIAQPQFANDAVSAFITVGGEVRINGGTLALTGFGGTIGEVPLATAPGSFALATAPEDFSLTVLAADGQLSDESLFTSLDLPETPDGIYWDVVYDTANDEIRLELVQSSAIGADFNNDNIVDQSDVDIWTRNVGITAGASIIQGDANLDGQVSLSDYELIMQQIFSGGTPVAFSVAVPEPTAVMLLCLAGIGFAAARRS